MKNIYCETHCNESNVHVKTYEGNFVAEVVMISNTGTVDLGVDGLLTLAEQCVTAARIISEAS